MCDAQLFDKARGKDSTGECSSENGGKLVVETADSHILKLEIGSDDRGCWGSITTKQNDEQ